ncbi:hypothetical protein [Hymenobacter latericus]|uniref:hypothetical protein n=1 Tax=Hymenobacter sp. YIM 151858-1 TaxID=2987688 RepID=UPI0022265D83|nr:hypothetical protein [Hymenobacter sp. YIM 151858-1]UYZ60193.1 hypothetical protein OIS50_05180 [Hymenobacter sp. YIM 151858-1]
MSNINKALTGMLYGGPALALAAAPWKNNVQAVYGFNAGGDAYTVFKPGSLFNSLTHLQPDGAYIVAAAAPGFELPGATLAASAAPAAAPPALTISDVSFVTLPERPYMQLTCRVTSSNGADTTAEVYAAYHSSNTPDQGAATSTRVPLGQVVSLRLLEVQNDGISSGDMISLVAVAPSGGVGRASAMLDG